MGGNYRVVKINISDLALEAATKAKIRQINPYIQFSFVAAFVEQRTQMGQQLDPAAKAAAVRDN